MCLFIFIFNLIEKNMFGFDDDEDSGLSLFFFFFGVVDNESDL